jgi:phytoene dehydrogenase-like protein
VLVGSGINSLACAALLARAGWSVCVLERNDWLGGAIRTAEITAPGFRHDVFSAWHPLWLGGPANALLGAELAARGLHYLNTELPTASVHDGGEAAFLLRSAPANVAEFERHAAGDGAAWQAFLDAFLPNADISFGLLGTELWSRAGGLLLARALRRLGRYGLHEFAGNLLVSSRDWLGESFGSEAVRALLAPWVLHTGLGPDAASSGFMTQVIGVAIQEGGMPVPRGGGARLPEALVGLITDSGGECRTGAEVASVLLRDGRAVGVATVEGERLGARRAVIANVTPTQLYGRLLGDPEGAIARAGRRFRFGRSEMQIHFALSEPPRWRGDERLGRTAIVHLTPGLDGVSRAVNEAERGLLPAEATVVCGQPLTVDESRAPAGAGMLWIQLQELPWKVRGDAAGELDVGDGSWTDELREAYADRIQRRLARHITNLDDALLARTSLSPADLERANPNLERGDPYAGSLSLDQNFLWRPFPGQPGHRTAVEALWQIGASTWPGPGLGAGSGTLVASELLRPSVSERLARRFRLVRAEGSAEPA